MTLSPDMKPETEFKMHCIKNAMELVKAGLSNSAAAKKCGISEGAIRKRLKQEVTQTWGGKRIFDDEEESSLANYVRYMASTGEPLSRNKVIV